MIDDDDLASTQVRRQGAVSDEAPHDGAPRELEAAPSEGADRLVGTMLGEYEVLGQLGRGGMGVVYRGRQPLLAKPVAIKVLLDAAGSGSSPQRLLEEARAVTAVRHPNIVDIFSFGTTPFGQAYFVMELLDGEPLDEYLRYQGGKLPIAEALELLIQVATGLGAAHATGVVHRDLKPANIFVVKLVDDTRFIKLLDFGLARRTDASGAAQATKGFVVGTPLYMAPEQALGGTVDSRVDLYALGCVAYELISGSPPFEGANVVEILHRQLHEAPRNLEGVVLDVPPELSALVMALLAKQPAERPASAQVVKKTLERIQRDRENARTSLAEARPAEPAPRRRIRPPVDGKPADEARSARRVSGLVKRHEPELKPSRSVSGVSRRHEPEARPSKTVSGVARRLEPEGRPSMSVSGVVPRFVPEDAAATRLDRDFVPDVTPPSAFSGPPASAPSAPSPDPERAPPAARRPDVKTLAAAAVGVLVFLAVATMVLRSLLAPEMTVVSEAPPPEVPPAAPRTGGADAPSLAVQVARLRLRISQLEARAQALPAAEQRALDERLKELSAALPQTAPEVSARALDELEQRYGSKSR